MEKRTIRVKSGCPLKMNRRQFFSTAGTMAVAIHMGILDTVSAACPDIPVIAKKARIRVGFARPNVDRTWLGWPGTAYDINGMQQLYTGALKDAAIKQDVNLEIASDFIYDDNTLQSFVKNLKSDPPDGILMTCMNLNSSWQHVNYIAEPKNRNGIPMVLFSPMGSSFTGHLQETRKFPNLFVGATQDVEWLATGLRMLNTVDKMKHTRLLICKGDKTYDKELEVIGTTLHYIPNDRFMEKFDQVKDSDEMRAIADYYTRNAKLIVEPTGQDIFVAAKNYIVIRHLMTEEDCHGYSMDCLGPVGKHKMKSPCLALSRLRDEGVVGSCEADWNAAISERLTHLLFNRPGFMQDPAPNTVNNTLMGAHCTCGTKIRGCDKPPEPFILRSHSESDESVAFQVIWPVGEKITIMKFDGPDTILLGAGRVIANIDTPPSGGCRTSVEVELDDVLNSLDTKGFHQLFIYGDLENEFKAYCQLAGIKVVHI